MDLKIKILIFLNILLIALVNVNCHKKNHDHDHYRVNMKEPKNTKDSIKSLSHDTEHIKEDIASHYDFDLDLNKMTEEEQIFHYFNIHDLDRNKKLDGLELLFSMNHHFDDPDTDEPKPTYNPEVPDEYAAMIKKQDRWENRFLTDALFVDSLLSEFDINNDGFLSYSEYKKSFR